MIPKLPLSERVEPAEMERRLADYKAGLVPCQPWYLALKEMRAEFGISIMRPRFD